MLSVPFLKYGDFSNLKLGSVFLLFIYFFQATVNHNMSGKISNNTNSNSINKKTYLFATSSNEMAFPNSMPPAMTMMSTRKIENYNNKQIRYILFNLKIRQNYIKVIKTKQILDICLLYIYAYNDKIGPDFFWKSYINQNTTTLSNRDLTKLH